MKNDFEFNIVLIGQSKVGKTSLVRSLKEESIVRQTHSSNVLANSDKEITKYDLPISDEETIPVAFVSHMSL